jgi:hypothetical protein
VIGLNRPPVTDIVLFKSVWTNQSSHFSVIEYVGELSECPERANGE